MFRANLLFPTLCYSERDKENPDCPTVFDSSKGLGVLGGLLKIRFLKNINESFIRNELIKNRTNPKYTRFYDKLLNEYRSTLTGIITARLENLLDLVIAVGSESIVNDGQYQKLVNDPRFLTPVYTEKHEYNLDQYDGPGELAKHIRGSNALYLSDESYEYRVSILKTLKTIFNLLTSKTFSLELKTIPIISISIDDFNKLDNVCKKINETNKNLQNYITISNHLHETCKILFKDTDFLLENNALTTYQRENIFNDPLKTVNLTWSSSCKLDTDDDNEWLPLVIQQKLKAEREHRAREMKSKLDEIIEINKIATSQTFKKLKEQDKLWEQRYKSERDRSIKIKKSAKVTGKFFNKSLKKKKFVKKSVKKSLKTKKSKKSLKKKSL